MPERTSAPLDAARGHDREERRPPGPSVNRASDTEAVLRFEDVAKAYGSTLAVENTNLALHAGEILTLLGPSGCGKTTTLRMGIGLERATRGRIWFGGRPVDSPEERVFVPPEKRNMGMVFQSYAIWPHLTVFENVAYPLRARRRPEGEIRAGVEKVLAQVGLASFAQRPGTKLSGGQQQRVAIARCLAFGPDTLLMDEPFSNLDARLRAQMRSEIKVLQRRLGIAVLFVTHDQEEALALSDRIAMMRAGRIDQIGSPTELYSFPKTAAVRDFIGRTILLPGRITARESATSSLVELDEGARCIVSGPDHTNAAPVPSRCVVAVRPEHVRVEKLPGMQLVAPGGAAENSITGEILALLFLGNQFEAEVRLPSGAIAGVVLPTTTDWREGSTVRLTFSEAQSYLWPEDDAAA